MGKGKPKILIVDSSRSFTGAFNSILSFCEALSDTYAFEFVIPTGSDNDRRLEGKFPCHRLPFVDVSLSTQGLIYLPALVLNSFRLSRLVRRQRVAMVHVNDIINLTGVGAKILMPRIPLIYHIRLTTQSYFSRLYKPYARLISRYADKVVCVSQAVKSSFSDTPGITTIYNPLPAEHPTLPRKREGNRINLLYMANYTPGKGQKEALEAFAGALQQYPEMQLKFVGGDMGIPKNRNYLRALQIQADALGIMGKVTFATFSENIIAEYHAADIFLNFSHAESFSRTCLEALRYGVPVIATDSGGPAELFEHEKSGLLVPVGDVSKMSAAIVKLAHHKDLREQFVKEGKRYIEHKFSKENTIDKLKAIYASLSQ